MDRVPTARPVTLKAIAARVGYSKNTVSLALRDDHQIPRHTRERIRAVAHQMGYRNNALLSGVMSQLGAGRPCAFRAKLALLSVDYPWNAIARLPSVAAIVESCRRRAGALGYSFDPFWLLDPEFTADRWLQIMHARGIVGAILVGFRHHTPLLPALRALPLEFPTVVAGLPLQAAGMAFSSVDHFQLVRSAVERVLRLGYRRPGLVVERQTDDLLDRRLTAGFYAAHESPALPPCLLGAGGARESLLRWFEQHAPDVVLFRDADIAQQLAPVFGPRHHVGFVHLDAAGAGAFAGMDPHHDLVGEAAVDLLLEQIRRREPAASAGVRGTFITAQWRDGASVLDLTRPATCAPAELATAS